MEHHQLTTLLHTRTRSDVSPLQRHVAQLAYSGPKRERAADEVDDDDDDAAFIAAVTDPNIYLNPVELAKLPVNLLYRVLLLDPLVPLIEVRMFRQFNEKVMKMLREHPEYWRDVFSQCFRDSGISNLPRVLQTHVDNGRLGETEAWGLMFEELVRVLAYPRFEVFGLDIDGGSHVFADADLLVDPLPFVDTNTAFGRCSTVITTRTLRYVGRGNVPLTGFSHGNFSTGMRVRNTDMQLDPTRFRFRRLGSFLRATARVVQSQPGQGFQMLWNCLYAPKGINASDANTILSLVYLPLPIPPPQRTYTFVTYVYPPDDYTFQLDGSQTVSKLFETINQKFYIRVTKLAFEDERDDQGTLVVYNTDELTSQPLADVFVARPPSHRFIQINDLLK